MNVTMQIENNRPNSSHAPIQASLCPMLPVGEGPLRLVTVEAWRPKSMDSALQSHGDPAITRGAGDGDDRNPTNPPLWKWKEARPRDWIGVGRAPGFSTTPTLLG